MAQASFFNIKFLCFYQTFYYYIIVDVEHNCNEITEIFPWHPNLSYQEKGVHKKHIYKRAQVKKRGGTGAKFELPSSTIMDDENLRLQAF